MVDGIRHREHTFFPHGDGDKINSIVEELYSKVEAAFSGEL